MRRLIIIVSVLLLCAVTCGVLCSCGSQSLNDVFASLVSNNQSSNNDKEESKVRVGADNLYSDNGYIDYADEVFYDVEKFPELADQGLFWCYWDYNTQQIVQVPADSEEGAKLVNPSKPTLINIHGMLVDGGYYQEQFYLPTHLYGSTREDFRYSDTQSVVNLCEMWMRKGWNVGIFQYNRFGAETSPAIIEAKVWATDSKEGMRYRKNDDSNVKDASEYCLAEHFCAEYIRAMRLLPDTMGSEEIRFLAHSMGGEVVTAGTFLLSELIDCGQVSADVFPDRITMMDTYFCVNQTLPSGTQLYMGPKDITINWSGKQIVNNNTGDTVISAMEAIASKGTLFEYYSYINSFLRQGTSVTVAERLKKISAYVTISVDFQGYPGYQVGIAGHNGVREWYMCSLYYPPTVDTDGNPTPCASLSTQQLKGCIGKEYVEIAGMDSFNSGDDIFEVVSK